MAMLSCAAATVLLAACGGGGGDSDATAQPPTISAQPVSQASVAGSSVTFGVSASGANLALQWQRSVDGGLAWLDVADATAPTLVITSVSASMNGHQFRVVLRSGGISIISSVVTLTVSTAAAPAITVQPADVSAVVGSTANFSVTASGTSLAHQWSSSPDGTVWTSLAGATQPTLEVAAVALANSGIRYRVTVSNTLGTVNSRVALLTVSPAAAQPAITAQPASASVIAGQTAAFAVTATGSAPLAYQWQASTNGGASFSDLPGATTASHTTPATQLTDNGKRYRVVVSNAVGSVTSTAATLTVAHGSVPVVVRQPANQSASFGDNDFATNSSATFSASLAGTPTPTLQWQVSTDEGRTFTNINGATEASYTTPNVVMADSGKLFRLVATNAAGTVASSSARLGVVYSGIGGEAWGIAVRPTGDIVTLAMPFVDDPWSGGGFAGLRQIDASGRVITLAGNSSRRPVDGAGQAASFRAPLGLVLDRSGNAFVIDAYAVRKITPTGVVSTFAGSTTEGGYTEGTGTMARFGGTGILPRVPAGIAIDGADNLYVADDGASAIRKITPAGEVTTLAGGSGAGNVDGQGAAAKFTSLRGLAVTPAGDVYVTDVCLIRKVSAAGLVTTVSGSAACGNVDGPVASARFNAPHGIASDASGNLYVGTLDGVRKISAAGVVSTALGTNPGFGFTRNRAVVVDAAGSLYIANGFASATGESWSTQIRKVTSAGVVSFLP